MALLPEPLTFNRKSLEEPFAFPGALFPIEIKA